MAHAPLIVSNVDVPIPNLPDIFRGLRIAHLSDLHLRRWNPLLQALQNRLLKFDYDLLVATGDFCPHPRDWESASNLAAELLKPLRGRVPMYGVLGNHDDPRLAARLEMPLEILQNRAVAVKLRDAQFELVGVEQITPHGEDFDKALSEARTHRLSILLAHYPSTVFRVPEHRIDLILSGHTHGGQIRWPLLGCIWTNDALRNRLARGLHRVNGTWLYVNAGIGVTPPLKIRINCPAELSMLTLQCAE